MPGPTAATMQDVLALIPVLPTGGVNQALVASLQAQIAAEQTQLATDNQAVTSAESAVTSDTATVQQLQQQLAAAQSKLATDQATLQTAQQAVTADTAKVTSLQQQLATAQSAGTPPAKQSTAVKSGHSSDSTIWDQPPADGFNLIIPAGVSVVWDSVSPRLFRILLQGNLDLLNGQISCDTLVTAMWSNLTCGTSTTPHAGKFTLLIADYGPIDFTKDPFALSRGVHIMGSVAIYGRKVSERCFTTGNVKGDTTIKLLQSCTGWNVGDQIFLPGTGSGVIDDDTPTIAAISADGLTITIPAPGLQFDHGITDKAGFPRAMFAVNINRRSINVESENKIVVAQRGHWMVMFDPSDTMSSYHVEHMGFIELGRSDKSRLITDPDGKGGGLDNPRARYAHHPHRCGPDLLNAAGMARMMIEFYSNLIYGSPGWGLVNHDSHCDFDSNTVAYVYGSGIAAEIGTETGCFCDNTICRTRHPFGQGPTDDFAGDRGNADWGVNGLGIWLQNSAVSIEGHNIITGCQAAFETQSLPFQLPGQQPVQFASKNLPAGMTYSQPLVPAGGVPQRVSGIRYFGCEIGMLFWALLEEPTIGRSKIDDCSGEAVQMGTKFGYPSTGDMSNCRDVALRGDWYGTGYSNTGTLQDWTMTNCSSYLRDAGMYAPTIQSNALTGCTFRALTGIKFTNAQNGPRTCTISNLTYIPPTAAEIASLAVPTQWFHDIQGGVPMAIVMRVDMAYSNPYDGDMSYYLQGVDRWWNQDHITLDGKPLWFPELGPAFPWSKFKNTPPILAGLNGAEAWAQFGLAMNERVVPTDAALLPGSLALTSSNPDIILPHLVVSNKDPTLASPASNVQYTSTVTGFVLKCKDSKGNFVTSQPVNLTDKSWSVVQVQADGFNRGVLVYCDSTQTYPSPW